MSTEGICDVKHKNIDERFVEVYGKLKEIENKQEAQDSMSIRNEVLVATLCKQVASLCKKIEWLGYTVLAALIGFVFWYIQQPKP